MFLDYNMDENVSNETEEILENDDIAPVKKPYKKKKA
jgi:hypothetical protein